MKHVDGNTIRRVLLEVIDDASGRNDGLFQSGTILNDAATKLGIRGDKKLERALLTLWSDLFRTGYVAWGFDLDNAKPPFYHLTEQGRVTLKHLSRDPANPDGYVNHIAQYIDDYIIAKSYLLEALQSFNSACFKAAAVMIGGAAESLILELKEALTTKMNNLSLTPNKNLLDWKIKKVIEGIKIEIEKKKKDIPSQLFESYEAYWHAFTQQIRLTRNEAGHPKSIDPVTPEGVHASLLIFPELAELIHNLIKWVSTEYK